MVETKQCALSQEEANLYDRQIRLWGLDSQKRLRNSTVLLIGLNGLGAEVCKNIVLGGIKSITLLDHKNATKEDWSNQFLIPRDKLGENRAIASLQRAQDLNPLVKVKADKNTVESKLDEFFSQFNVVVVTDCGLEQLVRINDICHKANIKFFCAEVYGFYGYIFADLQKHEYSCEKVIIAAKPSGVNPDKKQATSQTVTVKQTINYRTLEESLTIDKPFLKEKSKRQIQQLTSLFLLKVLLKFRMEVGRNPEGATRTQDMDLLLKIRDDEVEKMGLQKENVPDEYFSSVFSQISPVCAILGGELAQEIIKALSQNGDPLNNMFFYNPLANQGQIINLDK